MPTTQIHTSGAPGWDAAYSYADNSAKDIFNPQGYVLPIPIISVSTPTALLPRPAYVNTGAAGSLSEYSGPGILRIWCGARNTGSFFGGTFPPVIRVEYIIRNAQTKWQVSGVRQWTSGNIIAPVVFPIRLAAFASEEFSAAAAALVGPVDLFWEAISSESVFSGQVPIETVERLFLSGLAPGATDPAADFAWPTGGIVQGVPAPASEIDGFYGWQPTRVRLSKVSAADDLLVSVGSPVAPGTPWVIPFPAGVPLIEIPLSSAFPGVRITNAGAAPTVGLVRAMWIADRN